MNIEAYYTEWKQRTALLEMSQPAGWWRDGLPLGNGQIGAMPYGRICEERILLNHERLWYNGVKPSLPDVSHLLGEARALIEKGDYLKANDLYHDTLSEEGKRGECAVYHPAADLCFRGHSEVRFKNYRRYLDLAAGEALTYWEWAEKPQIRRSFVSRADDCIVVEQCSGHLVDQTWEINLELHDLVDAVKHDGKLFAPPIDFVSSADGNWIRGVGRYTDPVYEGLEYGIIGRVITENGAVVTSSECGKKLLVRGNGRILVVAKLFVYESSIIATKRLEAELNLLSADYEGLRERHIAIHKPKFESCRVKFTDSAKAQVCNEALLNEAYSGSMPISLLEKMCDYGRYLLLCSANRTSVPSNLQGIWNGDYAPPWDCFFMINENLEMNYWQALQGGMYEEVLGVFDFYKSHLDEYRENAQKLFGCRGIFIPALTSPETGLSTHRGSWIVNWISGAGWLCHLFYDYYLFQDDSDFLRDQLLPFMREVALFYEDYFTFDPSGQVVISPSTSPENWPKEFCEIESLSSHNPRLAVNATMDVAIARELLNNLLSGAQQFGLYGESYNKWNRILDGLPGYQVNEDGAIREWLDPRFTDNYEHRHLSHIYPVFPGFEIADESPLFEAFDVAVKKRFTVGLKDQTGWSLAHMANIRARMGDATHAYECLEVLMQTCVGKNLFTYHNDYRGAGMTMDVRFGYSTPFQIDANMGLTSAVYAMLIQSRPDRIRLLPALPEQLNQGSATGLQTRLGVEVDISWDIKFQSLSVTLRSKRDQEILLQIPDSLDKATHCDALISHSEPRCYEVLLKAGEPKICKWAMDSIQRA